MTNQKRVKSPLIILINKSGNAVKGYYIEAEICNINILFYSRRISLMQNEKELLKQWKADLHAIKEEKRRKKKRKKSKKNIFPSSTASFMNSEDVYYKKNGIWRNRNSLCR